MGKTRTPAWLSKLKQVGEVLKVRKGTDSPSSSHISGSDSGDQSPTSAFIRRSCEAPELARSLSLRRAKARADSAAGHRSDGSADASPLRSSSGHRLSRSIDALYALSQKKEEEQQLEQADGGPGQRDLDRATMELLATSLSRTKVAKHKELAERAARAARELKVRGGSTSVSSSSSSSIISKAPASDDCSATDRVALTFNASANARSNRRKSASDLAPNSWTRDRLLLRRSNDADSMMEPPQRSCDAGPSLCTSEDERDNRLDLGHARTTSMSCSEDAWENSSRHSRVTASEEAWEATEMRGSWGSDLFGKLRALKQLYSQGEGEGEEVEVEEDEEEGEGEEESEAGVSDFMPHHGWDSSDDDAFGDYLASPGPVPGWATPSRTHVATPQVRTPSRRTPEMASPSRQKLQSTPPRRAADVYNYPDFFEAEEKVLWKGADSDSDRNATARYEAKKKQSKNNLSCFLPDDVSGVVRESVAMVKYSQDPYVDFRHSMLEMILEKDIHQPADLEQLLHCYLTLNSPRQYYLIKKAFFDTWNELLARRSRSFWGAV